MPKIAKTDPKYKGKVGTVVHVDSRTYGHHVRRAPRPMAGKVELALRVEHLRNTALNGMAGMIKNVISAGYPELFKTTLYHRIVKLVKKEPGESRSFALLRLRGMEINEDYKLNGEGRINFSVKKIKQTVVVDLDFLEPFTGKKVEGNCYKNDLILFTWTSADKPPTIIRKDTEWIYPDKEGIKQYSAAIDFPCPRGTIHWLLALRQKLGINGNENAAAVDTFRAEGAQFIGSGSFNKKEQTLLEKRHEEIRHESPFKPGIDRPVLTVSETVKTNMKKKSKNEPAPSVKNYF